MVCFRLLTSELETAYHSRLFLAGRVGFTRFSAFCLPPDLVPGGRIGKVTGEPRSYPLD